MQHQNSMGMNSSTKMTLFNGFYREWHQPFCYTAMALFSFWCWGRQCGWDDILCDTTEALQGKYILGVAPAVCITFYVMPQCGTKMSRSKDTVTHHTDLHIWGVTSDIKHFMLVLFSYYFAAVLMDLQLKTAVLRTICMKGVTGTRKHNDCLWTNTLLVYQSLLYETLIDVAFWGGLCLWWLAVTWLSELIFLNVIVLVTSNGIVLDWSSDFSFTRITFLILCMEVQCFLTYQYSLLLWSVYGFVQM